MKCISLGLIAATCVVHAGTASASTGSGAQVSRPPVFAAASARFAKRLTPEQREEWGFLKTTAAADRFERDAARMALAKSGDANVRSIAATLINQHASAQPALQRMLHTRNIAPPMLSNDQRKVLNRLAKLQGAKFDREWMESVGLRSQQDDVQAFEKAAGAVRDPQLRGWIARTLPTLRWQLASAERAVTGETKFAKLAPSLPQSAIKSSAPAAAAAPANLATRYMGAPAATSNPGDLGEGNMLLGPTRPVAIKLTESNTR
jgi:predicted outer membrane protein